MRNRLHDPLGCPDASVGRPPGACGTDCPVAAECRTGLMFGGGQPAADLLARACASGDYGGEGICSVPPSGNRMGVYWSVLAEHFAFRAGKTAELQEAQRFANKYWTTDAAHAAEPNEYLVELDLA